MNETEKENLRLLEAAVASGDTVTIENAVRRAYSDGLKTAYAPALIEILTQANHRRHEDVVTALQILKDPRASDALFHAALIQHDYLNYDEYFGLARKCTWALADIGSPTAFEYLQRLAAGSNGVVARYAQKRLERWEDESGRKTGKLGSDFD